MNIAILDDHELIRVGVTSVLHDSPHDVTISAACAEELFESLEAGTPCDLLLLDILMPGTNGFEVAKRMRTEYPEIKIIVLSVEKPPASAKFGVCLIELLKWTFPLPPLPPFAAMTL